LIITKHNQNLAEFGYCNFFPGESHPLQVLSWLLPGQLSTVSIRNHQTGTLTHFTIIPTVIPFKTVLTEKNNCCTVAAGFFGGWNFSSVMLCDVDGSRPRPGDETSAAVEPSVYHNIHVCEW